MSRCSDGPDRLAHQTWGCPESKMWDSVVEVSNQEWIILGDL